TTAYGVDHYVCVSPYRLAGVTAPVEERQTVPESYGGQWYENPDHPLGFTSSSESQNKYVYFPVGTNHFSGGAVQDGYAASGHVLSDDVAWRDKQEGKLPADFVAYKNASGARSWFMFDQEVVALAAGVTDDLSSGARRDLTTTLDTRIAAVGDEVTITGRCRNGRDATVGDDQDLDWVHWANASNRTAVGYVRLDGGALSVGNTERSGSQQDVRQANPDTTVTRQVFDLVRHHSATHTESLAWAIVPNVRAEELTGWASRIAVLTNTTQVQAVEHRRLGLTMINTFTDDGGTVGPCRIDGPASVIISRSRDRVQISISDPTHRANRIVVEVRGVPLRVVDGAKEITVQPARGGVRLVIDTSSGQGRTFSVTLADR
ncbi:MAG: polysaccharide lyase beta-sandwich domain-containing protein, partial [Propionibacteriales bacterium]|nr:polysaccharide lyase beta-sandwich domain-containing protein [Propionibacteriales bacterium]